MQLTHDYTADIEHRFKYAAIAVAMLFLVVLGRLYYLQVMKGEFYHFFSTENSIKATRVPAPRGMIFDRRGQVLVDNRPSFNIVVIPQYVIDSKRMIDSLHRLLGMPKSSLEDVWEKRKKQARYQPLVVAADVSYDDATLIRASKDPWNEKRNPFDLRGVEVEVQFQRTYPESNIATHVLGYVREADATRLKKLQKESPGRYRSGDRVGVRGLEERWDVLLRGRDGYEERIVNAVGREVSYEGIASQLEKHAAEPGSNLTLTIDKDIQEIARDMFGERKGAAVAINPQNGAIIAMYSSPSYNLNRLAGPKGGEYWRYISGHPDRYLLNRPIQGGYPPASTYKIVTAIGALGEGVITPDEKITCRGAYVFGGRPYHCWRRSGHGPTSLHRAIVSSCDVFFYVAGLKLGVDNLAKYARYLGFGSKTGVPLSGERVGIIPTSEWKKDRFGVPWQKGETLSVSVGQGYDVVTPVQNAMLAAQVANGGRKLKLHLVEAAFDKDGENTYRWDEPENLGTVPIDPKILKMVKSAMAGVVSEPGGTAHRLSLYEAPMGGKTGTAQVVSLDSACRSEKCRDHAWFIGFSPVENPTIAVAVIVEHGGFGSSAAAPIAGAMMQKHFDVTRRDPTTVEKKEGDK
jgi:penicillin-binding protein 2